MHLLFILLNDWGVLFISWSGKIDYYYSAFL